MRFVAVVVFCVGVIVQTAAFEPSSIYGGLCLPAFLLPIYWYACAGRFITGLGVGSLSMAVPLYK